VRTAQVTASGGDARTVKPSLANGCADRLAVEGVAQAMAMEPMRMHGAGRIGDPQVCGLEGPMIPMATTPISPSMAIRNDDCRSRTDNEHVVDTSVSFERHQRVLGLGALLRCRVHLLPRTLRQQRLELRGILLLSRSREPARKPRASLPADLRRCRRARRR